MIKYDRSSVPLPNGLLRAGRQELVGNLVALRKGQKLKFEAYSDAAVKAQLKALFGRKCVFCESLVLGTQPGDVEHYRPKGKVAVADPGSGAVVKKPGYYWLAARWSNLLLSCADCNRPRTQEDADGNDRVIGKANFFPLADEAKRANSSEGISGEVPLLLDPCVDDPDQHLAFRDDGSIEAAAPTGVPSARGQATIRYCGLARAELLQMRARHRRTVLAAVRHVARALEAGVDPGADLDDLLQMLEPTEPYVAYTRHLVRVHLAPWLDALGLDL